MNLRNQTSLIFSKTNFFGQGETLANLYFWVSITTVRDRYNNHSVAGTNLSLYPGVSELKGKSTLIEVWKREVFKLQCPYLLLSKKRNMKETGMSQRQILARVPRRHGPNQTHRVTDSDPSWLDWAMPILSLQEVNACPVRSAVLTCFIQDSRENNPDASQLELSFMVSQCGYHFVHIFNELYESIAPFISRRKRHQSGYLWVRNHPGRQSTVYQTTIMCELKDWT